MNKIRDILAKMKIGEVAVTNERVTDLALRGITGRRFSAKPLPDGSTQITRLARKGEVHSGPMKVDKGIPFPENFDRPRRAYKYPFRDMEIGDSFPVAGPITREAMNRIRSSLSTAKSRGLGTFRYDDVPGGIRVWRVE